MTNKNLRVVALAAALITTASINVASAATVVDTTNNMSTTNKMDMTNNMSNNMDMTNNMSTESSTMKNVVSDAAVTAAVKAKYLADDKIKGLDIHVKTVNATTTLTGKVASTEIKDHAEAIARNTNGVKNIVSELEVVKG